MVSYGEELLFRVTLFRLRSPAP